MRSSPHGDLPPSDLEEALNLSVLLAQGARGDRAAFAEIYDATVGRVYLLALLRTRDAAEAETLAHDALLAAWSRSRDVDPSEDRVFSWLSGLLPDRISTA